MKYLAAYCLLVLGLAAYCLLVLGGNAKPTADDVKKVLKEVDAEVNDADLKKVVDSLSGKKLEDV